MTKSMLRCLCALLALLLICGSAALADSEIKTYKTYTPVDEKVHTVDEETWEYPIVNGTPGSGKPVGGDCYDEPHTYDNGVCVYCEFAGETFSNAMGVVLTKGMPAADALKLLFDAVPATSIVDATAGAGDKLAGLAGSGEAPEAFISALSAFPAETVDDVPCGVVTLAYTDAAGASVTENYAFDAADGTFFKLY